jgi:hypothetical protein
MGKKNSRPADVAQWYSGCLVYARPWSLTMPKRKKEEGKKDVEES